MSKMARSILRAFTEVGFIIFLFYTNLLMGQFTRSHAAERAPGFLSAVYDVFTPTNALIGLIGAIIGYLVIEGFRRYLNDT